MKQNVITRTHLGPILPMLVAPKTAFDEEDCNVWCSYNSASTFLIHYKEKLHCHTPLDIAGWGIRLKRGADANVRMAQRSIFSSGCLEGAVFTLP